MVTRIEARRIDYHEGYLRGIRVFHRGEEVTGLCEWLDPLAAAAELYLLDEGGRKFLRPDGRVAREIVVGVAFRESGPPPPLPFDSLDPPF